MKLHLLSAVVILLSSCAAVPVTHKTATTQKTVNTTFTIHKDIDNAFRKISQYVVSNNGDITYKSKEDGIIKATLKNMPITSYDNNGGQIPNANAVAIADMRRRVNNRNYVFPQSANIQCSIFINKNDQGYEIIITMDKKCLVTSYKESGFITKRSIPDVDIQSTGVMEKNISDFIEQ